MFQIEGKTDFTRKGNHYKGFGEIFWDAQKNPQKNIKIETDSEFSKEKIDTKYVHAHLLKKIHYTNYFYIILLMNLLNEFYLTLLVHKTCG